MDEREARNDLDKAEADIANAQKRVQHQRGLIEKLARDGHDTAAAEDLLRILLVSLDAMETHRRTILTELGI